MTPPGTPTTTPAATPASKPAPTPSPRAHSKSPAKSSSKKPPAAPILPPPQPDLGLPPPSRAPLRVASTLAALALLATAALGLYLSFGVLPTPLWVTAGFEIVALVTALLALGTALGKHDSGLGLALLCYAGCAVVTAGFGLWLGALPTVRSGVQTGQAPSWAADAVYAAAFTRGALAAAFVALASAAVVSRSRHSLRFLARAAALGIPAAVLLAALWKLGGFTWLTTSQQGAGDIFRVTALIVGGLACLVVFAVVIHHLIRAYEMGRPGARPELP